MMLECKTLPILPVLMQWHFLNKALLLLIVLLSLQLQINKDFIIKMNSIILESLMAKK